jgi:integrase
MLVEGQAPVREALPHGTVPRISRLMALAIRMERLLKEGAVADYADIARLGHVTRARVSQIMNLLNLAPDIQEDILFLPITLRGRDPVREIHIRPIAAVLDWRKQRKMWREVSTQ